MGLLPTLQETSVEKLTLLEIVQSVLSSMDGDSVSAISDTVESDQIVQIAHDVYNSMMAAADWAHLKTVVQLEASGDSTKPTLMSLPDDVAEVLDIRYNITQDGDVNTRWSKPLEYVDSHEFLNRVYQRNTSNDNVGTETTSEGISILYLNDTAPTFYTSFDDNVVIFDAYDSVVDTTLQSSKTAANVIKSTSWTNSNTFVPDMPARMFSTYLEKVRLVAGGC